MVISESLSSLPLQVAVHLNICLAPFLFIAEICCLAVKYSYLSVTYKVILVAVLLVYVLVEVIRLFLGIVGNLGEKIPALSGFWTLSMVLQLPIVLFLLLNPAAIPVPFEIIMLSIHFLFLIVEMISLGGDLFGVHIILLLLISTTDNHNFTSALTETYSRELSSNTTRN